MFKKIISMLITCVMVFILSGSILTQAAGTKSLDASLLKMNVPEDLILHMTDKMKQDILKNTIEFVGYEKIELATPEGEGGGDIIPMGTIPSANLDFYASVYKTSDSTDGRERYTIYLNYDWLLIPVSKICDPYGVAWDSTLWRPVPGSAYNTDMWCLNGSWDNTEDNVVAYSAASGVGWNAKWPFVNAYDFITNFEGYGKITIESKIVGPISGSSQLCLNYSHVWGTSGTIGLKFLGATVSFSGSASCDTQGTWANFNY